MRYSAEVSMSTTPAPYSTGEALKAYVKEIDADLSNESSVMLRSLVGNQEEIIKQMKPLMTDSAASNEISAPMA